MASDYSSVYNHLWQDSQEVLNVDEEVQPILYNHAVQINEEFDREDAAEDDDDIQWVILDLKKAILVGF